jgi:type IV secretory pathway TraG/TraD family ATPase VirD4
MKMLSEARFRQMILKRVTDPVVRSFWFYEFSKYPDRFKAEVIAPIQNKVGAFLSSPLMRNIVGQIKSSFSMRDVMDNQKILIANLSKGKIGEDNTSLLGSMLITKLQLAALSRTNILEDNRKDFYLYVDEFHSFVTSSFADLLAEARKYRLNLILAHQFIEQATG